MRSKTFNRNIDLMKIACLHLVVYVNFCRCRLLCTATRKQYKRRNTKKKSCEIHSIFAKFISFYFLCYLGKYSDEIDFGHLVIPRKVHDNGTHLTHNLTHHHDDQSDKLHYHIDLVDQTLHLELT